MGLLFGLSWSVFVVLGGCVWWCCVLCLVYWLLVWFDFIVGWGWIDLFWFAFVCVVACWLLCCGACVLSCDTGGVLLIFCWVGFNLFCVFRWLFCFGVGLPLLDFFGLMSVQYCLWFDLIPSCWLRCDLFGLVWFLIVWSFGRGFVFSNLGIMGWLFRGWLLVLTWFRLGV